jgi:hypothetical protein
MKKNKRFKFFKVNILNDEYKVYVFIGDKERANKEICNYLKEKKMFLNDNNNGKSIFKTNFHPCIWIDGTLDYRQGVGILCHEAIHSVSEIMLFLGMDAMDRSGNELLAYSVGAIIRQCLK